MPKSARFAVESCPFTLSRPTPFLWRMPSRQDLLVRCRKPYIFEAAVSGFLPKLAGKQNSRRTGDQDRNRRGRKNWRQPTRRPASRRRPASPARRKFRRQPRRPRLPPSPPKTLAEKLSRQRARRDRRCRPARSAISWSAPASSMRAGRPSPAWASRSASATSSGIRPPSAPGCSRRASPRARAWRS